MTSTTARHTVARAYAFYHSRASLAPRTRADAAPRIIGAYRAFCQLTGPDRAETRAEARAAILSMLHMEQRHKAPAIQAWADHVTMPHSLYAFGRTPRPDEIQPESVNVWLRLIERSYAPGTTELDRRHYWRQAYRAHLAAQNCLPVNTPAAY